MTPVLFFGKNQLSAEHGLEKKCEYLTRRMRGSRQIILFTERSGIKQFLDCMSSPEHGPQKSIEQIVSNYARSYQGAKQ